MKSIPEAFDKLIKGLELTQAERDNVDRQQRVVREKLEKDPHLRLSATERPVQSGSYSRRTAIRPLNDIDLFIILDEATHKDLRSKPPDDCLALVADALRRAYRENTPRIQDRSVNIELGRNNLGYDVVPAFAHAGAYLIPDRVRKNWIRTNPKEHGRRCAEANERAGGKLNALIKMAKLWNCSNRDAAGRKPLRSFHLEVMTYSAFPPAPPRYPDGIQQLFAHLAESILRACPDPAGVGPHIDQGMKPEERQRLARTLKQAASRAREALDHETSKELGRAHRIWRELLGPAYPERGA